MYDELIKRLREAAQWADKGLVITPSVCLEAADAIEELQKKLCNWCGVCPEERRRPSDCEIIYPNLGVPEVSIIPAEENAEPPKGGK